SREVLEAGPALFPVKPALAYQTRFPQGGTGKAFSGESYFTADNPAYGAVFTYYLKDGFKSAKDTRQETEGKAEEKGEDIAYPTWDQLRAEDREEGPAILLTVSDPEGHVLRRLTGPTSKGFHRVAWDLRDPSFAPVRADASEGDDDEDSTPIAPMVLP